MIASGREHVPAEPVLSRPVLPPGLPLMMWVAVGEVEGEKPAVEPLRRLELSLACTRRSAAAVCSPDAAAASTAAVDSLHDFVPSVLPSAVLLSQPAASQLPHLAAKLPQLLAVVVLLLLQLQLQSFTTKQLQSKLLQLSTFTCFFAVYEVLVGIQKTNTLNERDARWGHTLTLFF